MQLYARHGLSAKYILYQRAVRLSGIQFNVIQDETTLYPHDKSRYTGNTYPQLWFQDISQIPVDIPGLSCPHRFHVITLASFYRRLNPTTFILNIELVNLLHTACFLIMTNYWIHWLSSESGRYQNRLRTPVLQEVITQSNICWKCSVWEGCLGSRGIRTGGNGEEGNA